MQSNRSFTRIAILNNYFYRFKNCATEGCKNPAVNGLKGEIGHIIGFFCDDCSKYLEEIETRYLSFINALGALAESYFKTTMQTILNRDSVEISETMMHKKQEGL
jgi:hypothetical protein